MLDTTLLCGRARKVALRVAFEIVGVIRVGELVQWPAFPALNSSSTPLSSGGLLPARTLTDVLSSIGLRDEAYCRVRIGAGLSGLCTQKQ